MKGLMFGEQVLEVWSRTEARCDTLRVVFAFSNAWGKLIDFMFYLNMPNYFIYFCVSLYVFNLT